MADFLYWRAENHGFSYAYELETTVPAGLNVGKVVRMPTEWDPGFRLGAGWNTTYDFWDVFLNYTWYKNSASKSKTNSTNGFIPLWPVSASATGLFNTVKGKTKFVMNMGDLEVGRMLFLTKTVAIRPHWGARGGTLHQKFKNTFSVPSSVDGNAEQLFSGTNNFWGVGPRAGVNGEFHLDEGFSIRGNLAGALLYGKTKASSQTSVRASGSSTYTVQPDYTDNFNQLTPHLQLAIGFQWQTCFWCEKMFYKMGILWETNYWWNQFNLPVGLASTIATAPLPSVGNQPLTMEGLTVNFEWDF